MHHSPDGDLYFVGDFQENHSNGISDGEGGYQYNALNQSVGGWSSYGVESIVKFDSDGEYAWNLTAPDYFHNFQIKVGPSGDLILSLIHI